MKKKFIDKFELENLLNQKLSLGEICSALKIGRMRLRKEMKSLGLRSNYIQKHSDLTKQKIGKKRSSWIKNNPDKLHWKSKDKFKSVPCEKVKEFLKKLAIPFIEEYSPSINNRHFSIDIAMPDKLIALEINGGQHYEKDGRLKPYYQERHNLLESEGWTVYEIHYSACFDLDKWASFIEKIKSSEKKVLFDYFTYTPKKKNINLCKMCGVEILEASKSCNKCRIRKSKINWPEPQDLQKTLWEKSTTQIAKELGVSDNAIAKFCKKHSLTKPPRGYWTKIKFI